MKSFHHAHMCYRSFPVPRRSTATVAPYFSPNTNKLGYRAKASTTILRDRTRTCIDSIKQLLDCRSSRSSWILKWLLRYCFWGSTWCNPESEHQCIWVLEFQVTTIWTGTRRYKFQTVYWMQEGCKRWTCQTISSSGYLRCLLKERWILCNRRLGEPSCYWGWFYDQKNRSLPSPHL